MGYLPQANIAPATTPAIATATPLMLTAPAADLPDEDEPDDEPDDEPVVPVASTWAAERREAAVGLGGRVEAIDC